MGRRLEDVSRGVLAGRVPTGDSSTRNRINRDRPDYRACRDSDSSKGLQYNTQNNEQMPFDISKSINFQGISELTRKRPFSTAQQGNWSAKDKRNPSLAYNEEVADSEATPTVPVPCDDFSLSDRSQSSVTESDKDSNMSNTRSVHNTEPSTRPCHGRASLIRGLIDELRTARSMSTHSASQPSRHCAPAREDCCSPSTTHRDRKPHLQRPVLPSVQLSRGHEHDHEQKQHAIKNDDDDNNENERIKRHLRQRREDLEYLRAALGMADADTDAGSVADTNLCSERGEGTVAASCTTHTEEDSLFLSLCSDSPGTSCSVETETVNCLSDSYISPSMSCEVESNDFLRPSEACIAHSYWDNCERGMDIGPRYLTAQSILSDVGDTFVSDIDLLSDRIMPNQVLDQSATYLHSFAVNKAGLYSSECLRLLQNTCESECECEADLHDVLLARRDRCCGFADHRDCDQEQISPPTSLWENSQTELLGTIYCSSGDESEPTVLYPFALSDHSPTSDEVTPSSAGREYQHPNSVEDSLVEEVEDIKGLIDGLLGLADYFHRETASLGEVLGRTPTPGLYPHTRVGSAHTSGMSAYLSGKPSVTLCLMRAQGLPPVLGSTDAYVVLDWGRHGRVVSRVVENSTDPVFDESFEFHLSDRSDDSPVSEIYNPCVDATVELGSIPVLSVTLYCRRRSIQDEVLGTGTLDFDTCRVGRNTIRLQGVSDDSECGSLSLSIF